MAMRAGVAEITESFPELTVSEFRGQTRVCVPRGRLLTVLEMLGRDHGYDFLVDITCVDYLKYRGAEHRYGLVYLLAQTAQAGRLTLRVYLDDPDPAVPSVVSLWEAANWLEREVWDMFGIRFEGHPDLRRILLPEPFTAYPLRKDYPLQGRGERHNFPAIRRGQS